MSVPFDNRDKAKLEEVNQDPVSRALGRESPLGRQSRRSTVHLSSAEIEELIDLKAFYNDAFDIALSNLEMLVEQAELAAEQVQDKRIELALQGKAVSIVWLVGAVVLMVAIESQLVGRFLAAATIFTVRFFANAARTIMAKRIQKEIMSTDKVTKALQQIAKPTSVGRLWDDVKTLRGAEMTRRQEVGMMLLRNEKRVAFMEKSIGGPVEVVQTGTARVVKDLVKEAHQAEEHGAGDTPTVVIQESLKEMLSDTRLAARLHLNAVEELVGRALAGLPVDNSALQDLRSDMLTLLKNLGQEPLLKKLGQEPRNIPYDQEKQREVAKRQYEEIIWIMLYTDKIRDSLKGAELSARDAEAVERSIRYFGEAPSGATRGAWRSLLDPPVISSKFRLKGVIDDRLLEYWMARFLDEEGQPLRSSEALERHICDVYYRLGQLNIQEVFRRIDAPQTATSTPARPRE